MQEPSNGPRRAPRVLVPLAPGFEELEAITIVDVLRRAEVEVVTAALGANPVVGSHGIAVHADRALADVLAEDFAMVCLPGGMPGTQHLREDPRVLELLRRHAARRAYTTAICAAPSVLAAAGLLQGRRATSFPGFLDAASGAALSVQPVVVDGGIVTSRGPGTALDFALALVAELQGEAVRDGVAARLQRPHPPATVERA
jgi:4-methyl-5(b-hydroxyethyl)-thiazole monophosphate biosynthesis